MKEYYIAWWNVENLFDAEDITDRERKVAKEIGSEIAGWTKELRDKKIKQLASIIKAMNKNNGPDILGVCEVENKRVLELLIKEIGLSTRKYKIAHEDSPDDRGIDVAFIYDESLFKKGALFSHHVLKRGSTRNIVQVDLDTNAGNTLTLMGNHWPSRMGGTLESEGYRIVTGETLAYWNMRSQEVKGAPILVMGDFNDEPSDRSMTQYALSTPSKLKVLKAGSPRLLNLMWPIMAKGLGTFYYSNWQLMFDQFLVSKDFLKTNPIFSYSPAKIYRKKKMMKPGVYGVPKRFGFPKKMKTFDETGYSDHFPITIKITEH